MVKLSPESPSSCLAIDLRTHMERGHTNTRISVELQGHKVRRALLDSGSSISVIPLRECKRLGLKVDRSKHIVFQNVNGDHLRTAGITQARLKYQGRTFMLRLQVVEKAGWSLLLGTDFLVGAGLNIDFAEKRVGFKDSPAESGPLDIQVDDKPRGTAATFATLALPKPNDDTLTVPAGFATDVLVALEGVKSNFEVFGGDLPKPCPGVWRCTGCADVQEEQDMDPSAKRGGPGCDAVQRPEDCQGCCDRSRRPGDGHG